MNVSARVILFLALILGLSAGASGQFVREYAPFPVSDHGSLLELPFLGGLNNPKPELVDLDNEGRLDLLVGQFEGRLLYLRNVGTTQQAKWQVQSGRLGGIDIGTWYTLSDIDGDGDVDLFCDSRHGHAKFYRNGSIPGEIIFDLVDSVFGGLTTTTNITPAFVDIDADGDLDFFLGGIGGNLNFYRNIGTPQEPAFTFITDVYDSVLAIPGGGPSPTGGQSPSQGDNPMHGFNSITFSDYDTDGDYDLFWGDIFSNSLYCFGNEGDRFHSDLTWLTEFFLPSPTLGFNHVSFGDLDGDGKAEMLSGVANVADMYTLRLYRNEGTLQAPNFVQADSQYLKIIDVGSASMPTAGDLDNDGDIDLLVGGQNGALAHFINTGTASKPKLDLTDTAFANINVGYDAAPALVDWDSDGDLDLLVGNLNGRIVYYRNDGSKSAFIPTLVTDSLGSIRVDQLAVPVPVDFDGDGRIDLVVGEWDFNGQANVLLYENTGTAEAPVLNLRTSRLLRQAPREFTIPTVVDWDHDGRKDLLLGSAVSGVTWFRNLSVGGFPDSLTLVAQPDKIPGSDEGSRLALLVADWDGDSDGDLIIGEEDGGLDFYRNAAVCCVGTVGNVDEDSLNTVDIADLQQLIDDLYISIRPSTCPAEANVDGDWPLNLDIQDLTALVDYLFLTFRPLPACP